MRAANVKDKKTQMCQQPHEWVQTLENPPDLCTPSPGCFGLGRPGTERLCGDGSLHLSSVCQHTGGQFALLLRRQVKTSFQYAHFKKLGVADLKNKTQNFD